MFLTQLMIGVMVSSFSILVIFGMKKLFQKQLSAKWHYNLWLFLFIVLAIPFIPTHLLNFGDLLSFWDTHPNSQKNPLMSEGSTQMADSFNWIQDFSISVNRVDFSWLSMAITGIWIAGVLVFSIMTIRAMLTIRKIKTHSTELNNNETIKLFEDCKRTLGISKSIKVVVSPLVTSPMTFGVIQTYVVMPAQFDQWLSVKDIEYIFLHELNHYKNKDILTNNLMIAYQIIYWFNPLVWFAFREMRLDREIACDTAVLKSLDPHSYSEYGNTIIHFIDRTIRKRNFSLATQLNGSKEQIKRRIRQIAAFTPESKGFEWKSVLIFVLVGLLVVIQLPFISAFAVENNRYYFNHEDTEFEDLSDYFTGYEGSFVLYDLNSDQYRIYNEDKSTVRVSPNSTYKIYSALFALEANVITRDSSTLTWDGFQYPFVSWNQDHDLASALKNSVNWYFQSLDKHADLDTIQANLKQIHYGNTDVSGGIDSFWIESSLEISPVEQVEVLHDFYTNEFGFQEQNVDTVKKALRLEEKNGALLSGKTGTGSVNGKNVNGWFVGYVETKENTYFFATNIQNDDNSAGSNAVDITLSILKDKGIY